MTMNNDLRLCTGVFLLVSLTRQFLDDHSLYDRHWQWDSLACVLGGMFASSVE